MLQTNYQHMLHLSGLCADFRQTFQHQYFVSMLIHYGNGLELKASMGSSIVLGMDAWVRVLMNVCTHECVYL